MQPVFLNWNFLRKIAWSLFRKLQLQMPHCTSNLTIEFYLRMKDIEQFWNGQARVKMVLICQLHLTHHLIQGSLSKKNQVNLWVTQFCKMKGGFGSFFFVSHYFSGYQIKKEGAKWLGLIFTNCTFCTINLQWWSIIKKRTHFYS